MHDDDPAPQPPRNPRAIKRPGVSGDVVPARQRNQRAEELDEGPLEADLERFSGVTRTCPECHKDVFDDSAVCYHCGHAFERTTEGSSKTPLWIILTVVLLLLIFVLGFRTIF